MPFEESQASTHKQSRGRIIMKAGRLITSVVALAALTVIVTSGTLGRSQRVQEQNDDDQKSRIERGFPMAPVPLNLEGKNRELVGLGSYLVNAVASCNDCHSAGPQTHGGATTTRFQLRSQRWPSTFGLSVPTSVDRPTLVAPSR